MNANINLGLVDTDELIRVFDSVWMLRTEGKTTPGVIVFSDAGRRTWWITGENLTIRIAGDAADFTGAYQLPLSILANAGRQHAANGAVTLTVQGDVVTAESARGRHSVSCSTVPVPDTPRVAVTRSRATATLTGKDLTWVAFSGASSPFEASWSGDDDDHQYPDHFTIGIEHGMLLVSSDWTKAKLYPMLSGTAATTTGRGEVRVDPSYLNVLTQCVDADSEWTISFDPNEPRHLVLESATQYIVATMTKVPVVELQDRVKKILERERLEHNVAVNGTIGVRLDDVVISLHFYQQQHSEQPLLRVSTIVVRDANESADLLREINAYNCSGSITRGWFDEGKVYLGLDLLSDNLHVLAPRLRQLAADVTCWSGVLEPLAADEALPPRKRTRRSKTESSQPEVWL